MGQTDRAENGSVYAGYAGVAAAAIARDADGDGADSGGSVAGPGRAVVAATCDNNKSFYCSAVQLRLCRASRRAGDARREGRE